MKFRDWAKTKNASASAVDKTRQCARTKGDAVREHKAGIGKKSRSVEIELEWERVDDVEGE